MSNDSTGTPQLFALHAVRETLGRATDVDACTTLAARIGVLMEQAIDYFHRNGAAIACRERCSFCCHLRVMVYPHEAIALFRFLRARLPPEQARGVSARLLANAAEVRQRDREGRSGAGIPCAFLVDGRCSAYAVRPSKCAGYHSQDAGACERALDQSADQPGIPQLQGVSYTVSLLEDGVDAGLAERGLSGARVELHTALAALIRNPGLIERWRTGRELVKGAAGARP